MAAALGAVLACKPTPRSDALIATEVRDELRGEDELQAEAITVKAVNGEVTLQGIVPSEEARQRAEDIADDVQGVTGVSNRLEVASAPTAPRPTPPVSAPPPPPPAATPGEPTSPTAPPTEP
jgi:hypothetical protein